MSKVRTHFDAVTCDACGKTEKDPDRWLTLQSHFEVQDFGPMTNGGFNQQLRQRHYDACSMRCAKKLREALLTIYVVYQR